MDLEGARRHASQLSGGTSPDTIKALVLRCLEGERAEGSLLDFGAGRGELLMRLHQTGRFERLAGVDMFARPSDLPAVIGWHQQDLNDPAAIADRFDVVVCSETIEHLENPRHAFRTLYGLTHPGGILVLTMPNQECIRSFAGLLFAGHFTQFLGACYPPHITALLRMDLQRLCAEVGFDSPTFSFTDVGGIPKFPTVTWQTISFGLLRGRLFSDNLGMVTRRVR